MKLIAFLGNKPYAETTYVWNERRKTTRFSVCACVDFLKPDEIAVFLTKEAREKTFADFKVEMIPFSGVIKDIDIPLGATQDELWEIFNTINDAVAEGETIAMDVTNGQRSLPMLALLTAAFMKTARDVSVEHLLYGAFDVGSTQGQGVTPMFDLSAMLGLLDWSVAADRFIRSGDSRDMGALLKDFSAQVKKDGNYERSAIQRALPLEDAAHSLNRTADALFLLRPYSAMREIDILKKNFWRIFNSGMAENQMSPLYRLLEKIDRSYSKLGNAEPEKEDADAAARTLEQERQLIFWYYEHGHLMQSISLAREWLISWVMYRDGKLNLLNRKLREDYYEKQINEFAHNEKRWQGTDFIGAFMNGKTFHDLWHEVTGIRNDIAHAGKNYLPKEADALIRRIERQLQVIRDMEIPTETDNG